MPLIKMTKLLLERCGRLWRLSPLAFVLVLFACGPGVGGTGTGAVQPTGLYAGTFVVGSGGNPGGCAESGDATLTLQEASVGFRTSCIRFTHAGEWRVDPSGTAVLSGNLEPTTAAGTPAVPASLTLQFSDGLADGKRVTATLMDAMGGVILGPFVLCPVGNPPTANPAVCTN